MKLTRPRDENSRHRRNHLAAYCAQPKTMARILERFQDHRYRMAVYNMVKRGEQINQNAAHQRAVGLFVVAPEGSADMRGQAEPITTPEAASAGVDLFRAWGIRV